MNKKDKIYIAGHTGMVGSAIWRVLEKAGYANLVGATHAELDLLNQHAVRDYFQKEKPEYVILAAAKVGGIQANIASPAQFLYENLAIQNNVIHSAYEIGVKKFVFLGSSCIYPRDCPQPMKEEYLLTGPVEPTNEGYAIAKIAGLKMIEYYKKQYGFNGISLMPCNLYGPNDHFDPKNSHVLSALVMKFVDAVENTLPEVTMWGTGSARREFMHVDDLAEVVVCALETYDSAEFINVGWGEDVSIKELAEMVAQKTGFKGTMIWDTSKPDGMPRKCMEVSRMKELLHFNPKIKLEAGIDQMIGLYKQFKKSKAV